MTKLTDARLRALQKSKIAGKYSDGGGLYLVVRSSGKMLWQLRYKKPKANIASLGSYPSITLADARKHANELRVMIARGLDPNAEKRRGREAKEDALKNSFERIAREWFDIKKEQLSATYSEKVIRRLELYVFPKVGRKPISELGAPELLEALRCIEARGTIETARRVAQSCSQIFNHAIISGRAEKNPCASLGEALKRAPASHMPALTAESDLSTFLKASRGYVGRGAVVPAALRLLPMLLLRPGELSQGDWSEIDFEAREWRVPAMRMKQRQAQKLHGEPHVVPLAPQAMVVLRELHEVTGPHGRIFKGARGEGRSISANTLNAALRALGYDTAKDVTAHGFRATARTLGVEALHADERVIEAQLAHAVKDQLGRSYNRTNFFKERREFMRAWADYLDKLAEVGPSATHVYPIQAVTSSDAELIASSGYIDAQEINEPAPA